MPVLEINTLGVQNQPLDRRIESVESKEVTVSQETGSSLQTNEGDVVTLSFADKQNLSNSYSEAEFEGGQTVQEISSVARAASKYSQVVEGNLNEDELVAIQKIAAHVEPIAKEFLSSDPEELDVEKAIGILTGDKRITEEVGAEIGKIVVETLGLKSSSQASSDELVQSKSISVEAENSDINIKNIRQLPELASVTVGAELQKQFQVLNESSRALIINSLNDLMRFFQEKVSQVLEPLKHPISLAAGEMNFESAKPQA
ncbi:uncharacterized protein METZ01_LOCUS286310 [marine metagenome]|uniref:Uncharacterized protein n=1 Tax=marine metagenome TaxID=408172 RepID=A0A382L9S9_9ZZZZ